MTRVFALDWSGARTGAAERIRLAEARSDDGVVSVEGGRDRQAVVGHLIELARTDPGIAVGIDFAFGFPGWFLEAQGIESGEEAWTRADAEGERWLRECPAPFWGRPGVPRPELPAHLRRTEREAGDVGGIRPKSVFQIGGAGAVGTGSIRGMPHLVRLAREGWTIWPFHDPEPGRPVAFEIWPRLLTGPVRKRREEERADWLRRHLPGTPEAVAAAARASEDAFDAVAAAAALLRWEVSPDALPVARDAVDRREGRIWLPPGPG